MFFDFIRLIQQTILKKLQIKPKKDTKPLPEIGEEGEVGGEEEHVLGVAGGPAEGVAGLEDGADFERAGLLDGLFYEFVDELGDDEAEGEEHGLELAAEHEVGGEAAERYEDGDEGDPGEEVAELVALLIADVG